MGAIPDGLRDFLKSVSIPRRIQAAAAYRRLDLFLAAVFPEFSRTAWGRFCREGRVARSGAVGRPCEPSEEVRPGDSFEVTSPVSPAARPPEQRIRILHEDAALWALDKPPGLVVHPAPGHPDQTLVDALGRDRVFLVHRLDKETSGVILIAKTEKARNSLSRQFQNRTVKKEYLAVVEREPKPPESEIRAPLSRDPRNRRRIRVTPGHGRMAVTAYEVREKKEGKPGASLLRLHPLTGRTHQIRAHLAWIGHPVAGDSLYGSRLPAPRVMLHSHWIEFQHPTGGRTTKLSSPTPADFRDFWDGLRA